MPGAVIAIQRFSDFLGFDHHLYVLATDGCFYGDGMFRVASRFHTKPLEEIFQHKVFKMLLSKEKITEDLVKILMNPAAGSGFNVFCGPRIQPCDDQAMENMARYIIRASFSQERMTYVRDDSKVIYQSKDRKKEKIFDAMECLAAMCYHVPNKGEQMVRYYGYYSNVRSPISCVRKICPILLLCTAWIISKNFRLVFVSCNSAGFHYNVTNV